MLNRWHAEDRGVILHQLGTDPVRGLAPAESTRRLREHGPNVINDPRPPASAAQLARQFGSVFVLLLLAGAALSAYLGEWLDAVAIGAVVAANGLLGYVRERPTERALAALGRLAAPSARVVRGGKPFLIPAAELVPGDLAEVVEGDRVPADMRLYAADRLFADESALTGESIPVGKDPALVLGEGAALADRANMLFAGTVVTAGRGTAIVTATAMRTEVGGIARLLEQVEPQPTLLQRRLDELGQALALAGVLAGVALFAADRLHGVPRLTMLLAAVSLAVAAVPEGLPAIVTLALAGGVRRLARRGAVVRALPAAETLGSISVIATDKTGTMTRNELTVRELALEEETLQVTGTGYAPEGEILLDGGRRADPAEWETLGVALRIGALCSSARLVRDEGGEWRVAGDPTEGALLALAAKGGFWRDDLLREHPPVAEFPFTAERRRMTVVVPGRAGRPTALTKGAPDVVLAQCLHHRTPGGVRPLSPADRERILRRGEDMARRALRVLGLAYREDAGGADARSVERSMVWVGLVGMLDPPRPEVPAAVAACRAAGISPVIITGDHKLTALAIAREIGALRPGDEAISGEELDLLTPEALGACVERYRVYARVTAEHKLRIVRAWKRRGHLIAMSGDGVNDAPALREADIGIAMGRGGSEVTREAASMVLADDNFASIVAAVAEGRGIRENVRRLIEYLLACNAAEVLALFACALAGLQLPLVPVQLLWLNLAVAGLPALALGLEPGDPELMRQPPRGPREKIFGGRAAALLPLEGAVIAAVTLAAGALTWKAGGGDPGRAGTAAFAALGLAQLVHAFNCRHRTRSLFDSGPFGNPWLLGAVAVSGLLLALSIQAPFADRIFGTVPLSREDWLRVGALALVPLPAVEFLKGWLRARDAR
jgi:Ca2+-transporting ATPase